MIFFKEVTCMSLNVCWPTLKVELIKGYVVVKTGMTCLRAKKETNVSSLDLRQHKGLVSVSVMLTKHPLFLMI